MSRITEAEARNILRALTVPDQSIAETADAFGVPAHAVEAFAVRHGWPDRGAIAARLRAPAIPPQATPARKPQRRSADVVEDAELLDSDGQTWTAALHRLDMTHDALEKALQRAGRADLIRRLKERDPAPAPRRPTPTPTQEPTVNHLTAVPEVVPDTLDDLTRRATTPKAKRLAEKAWAALDALAAQVRDDETTQHARDEIARLEKQLADARAALTGTKKTQPPKKPADTQAAHIRAWARENGIDVPARGVLPNRVTEAYEQAHGGAA